MSIQNQSLQLMQMQQTIDLQQQQLQLQQQLQAKQQLQMQEQMKLLQNITAQQQAAATVGALSQQQSGQNISISGSQQPLSIVQQLAATMTNPVNDPAKECTSITSLIVQLARVLTSSQQQSLAEQMAQQFLNVPSSNTAAVATCPADTNIPARTGGSGRSAEVDPGDTSHVPHDITTPSQLFDPQPSIILQLHDETSA